MKCLALLALELGVIAFTFGPAFDGPSLGYSAPMGVNAEKWLRRLLGVVERKRPVLTGWDVQPSGKALEVRLSIANEPVTLWVSELGGPSYADTASLSWSVRGEIPRHTEPFLRQLLELARRADSGDLTLPQPAPATLNDVPSTIYAPEAISLPETLEPMVLTSELHRASWRAFKIPLYGITVGDECRLGLEVETDEILDGWKRSLAYRDAGIGPYNLGFYVHVPFCARACTFCHCSFTDNLTGIDAFSGQLIKEMETFAPTFEGQKMTSVFFGGGTPSMLSIQSMKAVFGVLYERFEVPEGTQIAFECNPDSFNERKLEVLVEHGRVNRLTLGVQAFDPAVQKLANRFNKPDKVARLVAASRKAGIGTLNIDLMVGLEGQQMEGFQKDVAFCVALQPDALHLMPFHPDPWTPFARSGRQWDESDARRRRELLDWGREYLGEHGYTDAGVRSQHKLNRQLDDHRANGSTLAFGVPGGGHSWGGHYYTVSLPNASLDAAIDRYNGGPAIYRAVATDRREEGRQGIIRDFRKPFSMAGVVRRHGATPEDILGDAWQLLVDRGIFRVVDDDVQVRIGAQADLLIYRALIYDDVLVDQINSLWGETYDPAVDYRTLLSERYGRS